MIEQGYQFVGMNLFNWLSIQLFQQIKMGVKVDRVAVIVTGLFEIDAVRFDLSIQSADQYFSASVTPVFSFTKFRQQSPQVKQTQCLACQMCIGAEIGRKKCLKVTG